MTKFEIIDALKCNSIILILITIMVKKHVPNMSNLSVMITNIQIVMIMITITRLAGRTRRGGWWPKTIFISSEIEFLDFLGRTCKGGRWPKKICLIFFQAAYVEVVGGRRKLRDCDSASLSLYWTSTATAPPPDLI